MNYHRVIRSEPITLENSEGFRALMQFGRPDAVHIGHAVLIDWDADGRGFLWHHPECKPWAFLRFVPDPKSTGHQLTDGGPDDMERLTIEGSLLCPMGCGKHGFIRDGQWVAA